MWYVSRIKSSSDGKIVFCFFASFKFQGFGFLASFDNPSFGYKDYILFDFRFIFLKIWLRIDRKIKKAAK